MKDIFPGNDLNCGVGPLEDRYGTLATGLVVTAWLSVTREHTAATQAAVIHADLSITLTEEGVTGEYRGYIDKAEIDEHLYDGATSYVGETIYLHRSDPTGYHSVEACKVRPVRRA